MKISSNPKRLCCSVVVFLLPFSICLSNTTTNPGGLTTQINALSTTIDEEIGNTSLSTFNSLSVTKQAFTFESSNGFPTPDLGNPSSRVNKVNLTTAGGSGLDVETTISYSGSNFGNLSSNFKNSGGAASLVWNTGATVSFTFDENINGFAFTANRILGGSATVRLYSDEAMTSQIGSDYTISDNTSSSGSEHSFFGFYDSESSIRGVKIIHAGTAMFGVDDVTLAVTPDPVTGTVILLGTIFPQVP